MSSKSSKADLLVRVRYQNPLPPPPFPPKLLVIPTDPARYATYDFLLPLEAERELPMVVDAELGMPVELGKNDDAYWAGDMSNPNNRPELHPDDLELLKEPSGGISTSTGLLNPTPHLTSATSAPAADRKKAEVSWLRRTEYLAAETTPRKEQLDRPAPRKMAKKKRTKAERISAISETFAAMHKPLESLQHPTKRDVHAVGDYPVFHDDIAPAEPNSLIRFSDDPFDKRPAPDEDDDLARLSQSFLRIVSIPGEPLPRIAVYLPSNADVSRDTRAKTVKAQDLELAQAAEFRYLRHFEPHTSRDLRNEFLLAIDDGVPTSFEEGALPTRQRGAYLSPVGRLQQIRKRAPLYRDENPKDYSAGGDDFWDKLDVKWYDPLTMEEQQMLSGQTDLVETGDQTEMDVTNLEGSTF